MVVGARALGIIGPDGADDSDGMAASVDGLPSIMIIGDSITHGAVGDYTWRYFLYEHLADEYGQGDFFVGPHQAPNGGAVEDYAVPAGWDKDHAALTGRKLDCYLHGPESSGTCQDPDTARADLEAHTPDLVIVLLGANGVLLPWGESTVSEFVADMEELVELGRELNPEIAFLLLGVLPVGPSEDQETVTRVAELQAAVEGLAAWLDTPASRVVYAPAAADFETSVHTADGVHPNALGDELIAANVADALAEEFGIG